jgi:hypothetical protein
MKNLHPSIEPLEDRIAPATLIVTSIADNGPGTLRAALATADATPSTVDTIIFKLPAVMSGPSKILLTTGEFKSLGNVNIVGPGASKLTIDAQQNSRVFDFDDGVATKDSPVSISGMTIQNGEVFKSQGAGIYSTESLTLKSVIVSGCTITGGGGYYFGGGIAMLGNATAKTKASISDSTISGNSAALGGGLGILNSPSVSIKNSVVSGNQATAAAGLIINSSLGGTIAITGSVIEGNTAGLVSGGAEIQFNGKTLISGTRFVGNNGGRENGGLVVGGENNTGSTTITGSIFSQNTAQYEGGGLAFQSGKSITISKSLITGNQATGIPQSGSAGRGGAGIYIYGYATGPALSFKLSSTVISGNSTATNGAGISAFSNVALSLTGCTVSNNVAVGYAGGIQTFGTGLRKVTLTLSGGLISGNHTTSTTGGGGGGIAATGDGAISVTGTSISGNTAGGDGGGIFILGDSEPTLVAATITGAKIAGNQAAQAGGGISVQGGVALDIASTSISGNIAAASTGGGLFAGGNGASTVNAVIAKSTFTANRAAQDGGGIDFFGDSATFSLTGSTLAGNVSAIGGGGLSVNDSKPGAVKVTASKITGNSAVRGGGAIAFYNAVGFEITASSISGNAGGSKGGGLYLLDCTSGSILATSVTGNTAISGGGIYNAGANPPSSITVLAAKVTANTAPTGPDFNDTSGTFHFV